MKKEELIDFCEMKSQLEPENEDIFNYIIEALEQEPCEDCISRERTMLRVREFIGNPTYTEKMFVDDLNALPSATPQPKIGRWYSTGIQGEIDGQIIKSFICSECSAISVFRMAEGKIVNGDLCPNCGAKMEEVEE